MKSILCATVLAFSLPLVAHAAPQSVSNATIQQARKEVKKAFCNHGRQGFIKLVSSCYLQSENKEKCMLEDAVLIVFDQQMDSLFKSQTGQGVQPDGFLSDTAIKTRTEMYYIPRFGSLEKAMIYFSKGGQIIINDLSKCQNIK